MIELIMGLIGGDRRPDCNIMYAIEKANRRSSKWSSKRKEILTTSPKCSICGNTINLNVHHIMPYHLFPHLELVNSNLLVLCEGPVVNCHFLFGHARNWRSYNPKVLELSEKWRTALESTKPDLPTVF